MSVIIIAKKNIKVFLKNIALIPILIGMPVFQIYLLSSMMDNVLPTEGTVLGFVEIVLLRTAKPSIALAEFFAASILVTFLLIAGMIAATSIIEERRDHTLMRTFAAPLSKAEIIFGNLLGQVVTTFAVAVVIIAITQFFLGIDWGSNWAALGLVTMIVVYVAIALGFVFAGIFKDAKTAGGVMSFVVIMMSFLSDGLTAGSLTGSGGFGVVSSFTINKWAYEAYIGVMQGRPVLDFSTNLVILLGIGTLFALWASVLFRRENVHE